jgi:hypothetical protein
VAAVCGGASVKAGGFVIAEAGWPAFDDLAIACADDGRADGRDLTTVNEEGGVATGHCSATTCLVSVPDNTDLRRHNAPAVFEVRSDYSALPTPSQL